MKKKSDFTFGFEYQMYLDSREQAKKSKWWASQHYLLYGERV
tara:strand:- start:711 stop:836 length:126 start_codon:yes stop_codon:yes gene_type:complete